MAATSFERLASSFLLFVVALSTCARCQTPSDTFPRDLSGHRVTAPRSDVTVDSAVTQKLVILLGTRRSTPLFFCVLGYPDSLGVHIQRLLPTSLSSPPPRCNSPRFIGGLTLLPSPVQEDIMAWERAAHVLAHRADFVILAVVDTLLESGPRMRWITAVPIPADTTSPVWKHET